MDAIYKLLDKYDFFKNKNYELMSIQDFGRKSKFLVKMDNNYYTVLLDSERLKRCLNRIEKLGDFYKNIIKLKYLSDDNKVMVLEYYGGYGGHDLAYYHRMGITLPNDIPDRLKTLLDNFHSKKRMYINIDVKPKQNTWYEFVYSELTLSLYRVYEYNGITQDDIQKVQSIIEKYKKYFDDVECSYIHGDVTSVNVCYNEKNDELYLIDFDDVMIGDPMYDYARICNFSHEVESFQAFEDKYFEGIHEDIIYHIYTLRVYLNWYWYIKEKN